ncbi:hypothetical protein ABW21_db0208951 [Orbilia brochopaga]|nr:hypothetical protein ABW21_db0208951 [Drechslerella brochopaga]
MLLALRIAFANSPSMATCGNTPAGGNDSIGTNDTWRESQLALFGTTITGLFVGPRFDVSGFVIDPKTASTTLQPIAFRKPFKLETVFTYAAPGIKFSAPLGTTLTSSPPEEQPEQDTDVLNFVEKSVVEDTAPVTQPATSKGFSDLRPIDDFPAEWQEDLPTGYIQRAGKLEPTHVKAAPDETQKSIKSIAGWEVLTSFEPETSIESFLVHDDNETNAAVDASGFEVKDNVTVRKDWKPVTEYEDPNFDIKAFIQEEPVPEGSEEAAVDASKADPAPAAEQPKAIREALVPLLSYPKIEALLPPKEGIIVFTRQVVA